MTFEEIERLLPRYQVSRATAGQPDAAAPSLMPAATNAATREPGAVPPADAIFRVDGRLVEVHVTVTDRRGRYSDDLPRAEFTLQDDGLAAPLTSFENQSSAVSLALLFDATGSMQNALPPLKSAALKLIGELRPADSVAVYSFNISVTEAQPFTTDKAAAERAVLGIRADGATALYDAMARVSHDLAGRAGKKAIVVFTDGEDNQSVLTPAIAAARARAAAAPIYTIAQGAALRQPQLLEQLAGISKITGGLSFAIHEQAEILKVFESVSQDLTHGYLLTFQPSAGKLAGWHHLKVTLLPEKGLTVRAREGYSLD